MAGTKTRRSPTKLTPNKKAIFLKHLAETCSVKASCAVIKMDRGVLYNARKDDPDFAALWEKAKDEAMDEAEYEAFRRGVRGIDKPLTFQGQLSKDGEGNVVTVKEYSDRLLEMVLRGHKPEKYRESGTQVNVNVAEAAGVLEQAHEQADKLRLEQSSTRLPGTESPAPEK